MVDYDDVEPTDKVRVYDAGVNYSPSTGIETGATDYQMRIDYRNGDIWIPHLERREALTIEVEHFVDCIRHGRAPLSSGTEGLEIIRILEAATQSLFLKGQPIAL